MANRSDVSRREFMKLAGIGAGAAGVSGFFSQRVFGQSAVWNTADVGDVLWSAQPAPVWAQGYPIGNGRLGAMVQAVPMRERISLNHDRLWRRFWSYQKHNIAEDMPRLQQLCLEEKWDEAYELMKTKIPIQGKSIYVNPFAPLGDLGIYPNHFGATEISDYRRELDMDTACVKVSYQAGSYRYMREYFVSHPAGILAVRMSANRAARLSGEISMYRMFDSECRVTGSATLDELVMRGEFEEGVRFASVLRVIHRGGRLTGGLQQYTPPDGGTVPSGDLGFIQSDDKPHWFRFRNQPHPSEPRGVSTRFDAADEIILLAAVAADHDDSSDPAGYCKRLLDRAPTDYDRLRAEHVRDHQSLYRRVSLSLTDKPDPSIPTDKRLQTAIEKKQTSPIICEQLFNLGRYLAIAAGRPADRNRPYKAPMNLQGLWNEDPRPAWDCDYHLDLNIEMCYWPLPMANLVELTGPLVEWAYTLLPQAKIAAKDIYGVNGAFYNGTCDAENLGNLDDLGFLSTGVTGWLAQILWLVWEYNRDVDQLRYKIYPILREIGRFYEAFLVEDNQGRLLPLPSGSPEICPAGRSYLSMLSASSTFDLELIRQVFTNLIEAAELLRMDSDKNQQWSAILNKLPYPTLNNEGRLLEWLEHDYEVTDPGHRHRSHIVGFCPGDRITAEDTPEYNQGIRKAIELRLSHGDKTSISIDKVWDAQIFARLYDGAAAMDKINAAIRDNMMDNLLMCICEWREGGRGLRWFGDQRVYQIEASFGMMGAITEMLFQDRRGLLRLLPALPKEWPKGHVTGLLARGGFEVDLRWRDGRLIDAGIQSRIGGLCRVKSYAPQGELSVMSCRGEVTVHFENDVVEFQTEPGERYLLKPA